jgi:hypothetical protein
MTAVSVQERLVAALASDNRFGALYALTKSLVGEGHERQALVDEMERLREALHRENREDDEDVVLDVMDCLTGFCGPDMRI